MNTNTFTVYQHIVPNGKRYIGITSMQPYTKRFRCNGIGYKLQPFYKAILKYGWDNIVHEVLFENLSEEQAKEKEIELIKQYKTTDSRYGYNYTQGGDGRLLSDEKKKLLSEKRQGTNAVGYGYFPSEETKQRMSLCAKNRIPSDESRKKMASKKQRKVYQYDILGNLLNIYDSIGQACCSSGCSRGAINKCCLNNSKIGDGFYWSYFYIDKSTIQQYLLGTISFKQLTRDTNLKKSVIKLSLNGDYICTYNSLTEASADTNISAQEIGQSCNNPNKVTRSFKWRYGTDTTQLDSIIMLETSDNIYYKFIKMLFRLRKYGRQTVKYRLRKFNPILNQWSNLAITFENVLQYEHYIKNIADNFLQGGVDYECYQTDLLNLCKRRFKQEQVLYDDT